MFTKSVIKQLLTVELVTQHIMAHFCSCVVISIVLQYISLIITISSILYIIQEHCLLFDSEGVFIPRGLPMLGNDENGV